MRLLQASTAGIDAFEVKEGDSCSKAVVSIKHAVSVCPAEAKTHALATEPAVSMKHAVSARLAKAKHMPYRGTCCNAVSASEAGEADIPLMH